MSTTIVPIPYEEVLYRTSEHTREKIVKIIFFIYVLLILEGAIRKWVFPGFGQFVFFIRVPVTFWLYFVVLRCGVWPRPHKFLLYGIGFSIVGLILIPVQMVIGDYSFQYLILAAYGWINYFFYIPLAFIIAEHVRLRDLQRIIRMTLILAIIAAPLTILQLYSPADSPLVRGFGTGALNQFTGLGFGNALIRPMGYFTSSSGQQMFTSSVLACVLAVWIIPHMRIQMSASLRFGGAVAIMILIGVSMQRGALVHGGIVLFFALLGGMLTLRRSLFLRSIIYPLVFVIVGVTLVIIWLPEAFEMFSMRLGVTDTSKYTVNSYLGLFDRIIHELIKFVSIIEYVPTAGYLLGLGGNAASQLSWVEFPMIWHSWNGTEGFAEDGLSRNIIELGPVFGFMFIFYRITFFLWLFKNSFLIVRNTGEILPMVLVAFVGPLLLTMQMTGHGTIIGYAWMFIGFTIVCLREAKTIKKHNLKHTRTTLKIRMS